MELRLGKWAGVAVCAAALYSGCRHRVPDEPADDLAGMVLPLKTSGAVRLAVEGKVGDEPAEVLLEVAQPLTLVSSGCFEEAPDSDTTVRVPSADGVFEQVSEVRLGGARVGDRRLGVLRAGLVDQNGCELTLGSDVLGRYALEVDPEQRTVRFDPSSKREDYVNRAVATPPGEEAYLVELVRDPDADWPLLAARALQGPHALTGTFVLVTSVSESAVSADAAEQSGLQTGPEFLRQQGVPLKGIQIPKALGGTTYGLDRLELTPGFGVARTGMEALPAWKNKGAVGRLGGGVWGHFRATIDPAAGVLLLRRPRLFVSGSRQRCAAAKGGQSEEACFVLNHRAAPRGLEWMVTVWRELPRGGRIDLEVLDAQGTPVDGSCRVGMSFGPSDRGANAAHTVPFLGLMKSMPICAEKLAKASSVRFGFWQEGSIPECPGTCAFIIGENDRMSCECQASGLGPLGEAEREFLQRYRELLRQMPAPQQQEEEEPD